MSGHSHWSTIKHQKETEDQKRGKSFSKIARLITIAAREGGGDPGSNPGLRSVIEKAKSANMPTKKIDGAIERGSGEATKENLERITYEALGPGGIRIIVEVITDNKNRTLEDIKQTLSKNGGKLAEIGSVKWLFEQKGTILVSEKDQAQKEAIELQAIEAGAEDIRTQENNLIIPTQPSDLQKVIQSLREKEIDISESSLEWIPKNQVSVSEKDQGKFEKLLLALDQNEDVQEVYDNIE